MSGIEEAKFGPTFTKKLLKHSAIILESEISEPSILKHSGNEDLIFPLLSILFICCHVLFKFDLHDSKMFL